MELRRLRPANEHTPIPFSKITRKRVENPIFALPMLAALRRVLTDIFSFYQSSIYNPILFTFKSKTLGSDFIRRHMMKRIKCSVLISTAYIALSSRSNRVAPKVLSSAANDCGIYLFTVTTIQFYGAETIAKRACHFRTHCLISDRHRWRNLRRHI